jgi:hypothetical protein
VSADLLGDSGHQLVGHSMYRFVIEGSDQPISSTTAGAGTFSTSSTVAAVWRVVKSGVADLGLAEMGLPYPVVLGRMYRPTDQVREDPATSGHKSPTVSRSTSWRAR